MTAENAANAARSCGAGRAAVSAGADKARADDTRPERDAFEKLVQSLRRAIDPSSGFDLAEVDADKIMQLMGEYTSDEEEWAPYCMGDDSRAYTRNLVDEGNGKANLLVLVWSPGKGSPIHDHGNAHCVMKVLKGCLTETRYGWPEQGGEGKAMQVIGEKTLGQDEVGYMSDDLGLHRMFNPGDDFAVSLHLYSPPHVARDGCYVFNAKSGTKSHVKSGFYSKFGQRVKEQ